MVGVILGIDHRVNSVKAWLKMCQDQQEIVFSMIDVKSCLNRLTGVILSSCVYHLCLSFLKGEEMLHCNHLSDALKLWKSQKREEKMDEGKQLSYRFAFPHLYRHSSIRILYETKRGRVVNCYLCGKTWYTQAEYSKHLSMQR